MVHKIASDFRYARSLGITGTIDNVTLTPPSRKSPYTHWKNNYLNFYVYGKAAWDPYRDIDSVVNDFIDHYYGPAAEPMKRFWVLMEKVTLKFGLDPDFMPDDKALTTPPAIHEWMWNIRYVIPHRRCYDQLKTHLDLANELARSSPLAPKGNRLPYLERIEILQNWLALWEKTKTDDKWSY
jgi:hypothetical protein